MDIGGYAWEKTGKIWHITLRDRLRPNSDFKDAAKKHQRLQVNFLVLTVLNKEQSVELEMLLGYALNYNELQIKKN